MLRINSRLLCASNVSHVRSAIGIRTSKRDVGVPIDPERPDEDLDGDE